MLGRINLLTMFFLFYSVSIAAAGGSGYDRYDPETTPEELEKINAMFQEMKKDANRSAATKKDSNHSSTILTSMNATFDRYRYLFDSATCGVIFLGACAYLGYQYYL